MHKVEITDDGEDDGFKHGDGEALDDTSAEQRVVRIGIASPDNP